MTDQDYLARNFIAAGNDDDPLAELARIVASKPERPVPSFRPRPPVETGLQKMREMQAEAAPVQPIAAPQPVARELSIEDALMRELGFAADPEPEPEAVVEDENAHPEQPQNLAGDDGQEWADPQVFQPEPEMFDEPVRELSLEEQLMAELGLGDESVSSAPRMAVEAWTDHGAASAQEQSVESAVLEEFAADLGEAGDWRMLDEATQPETDFPGPAISEEQLFDEIASAVIDGAGVEAIEPPQVETSTANPEQPYDLYEDLARDLVPFMAPEEVEASRTASDMTVPSLLERGLATGEGGPMPAAGGEGFWNENEFRDLGSDLAAIDAEERSTHVLRAQDDHDFAPLLASAVGRPHPMTQRDSGKPGTNGNSGGEESSPDGFDDFADIEAAFADIGLDQQNDPLALELDHLGRSDGGLQTQDSGSQTEDQMMEDALFRDLADAGTLAAASRGGTRQYRAENPLYGSSPADFLHEIQPETHEVAVQGHGGVNDYHEVDFGAAFDQEFQQLERERPQSAPFHVPASNADASRTAAAASVATGSAAGAHGGGTGGQFVQARTLDDNFAAAFAEELEFGLDDDPDAGPAGNAVAGRPAYGKGWQHGETHDAVEDFNALAASSRRDTRSANADGAQDDVYRDYGVAAGADYDPEPEYDLDPDGQAEYAPPPRRYKGFIIATAALGVMVLIGGGAFAYSFLSGGTLATGSDPVVVKADTSPVKVRPEEPGGTTIGNQDKAVYDRVAGATPSSITQDKLVSDVEEPVDVAALAASESEPIDEAPLDGQTEPRDSFESASAVDSKIEERLAPGLEAPATGEAQAVLAPRRVKTVSVKPDGTLQGVPELLPVAEQTTPAAAPAVPATETAGATAFAPLPGQQVETNAEQALRPFEAQATTAASPPPATQQPDPAVQPVRNAAVAAPPPSTRSAAPAPARQQAAAPAPAPERLAVPDGAGEPVRIASLPAANNSNAPAASASPWAVQLASQKSAEDAQATFQNLRRKFPAVLEGKSLAVQRAEVEGKGVFFRVRVPAQTRDEANALCERLKAAGGSCFVTR